MLFCADPKFGLNHQALALLAFLAGRPPSFAPVDPDTGLYRVFIQTFPWYNGREAGVALVIYRDIIARGPCRVITFGECRETDGIFVEHWEEPREPLNGPAVEAREKLMERKSRAGAKTIERRSFDRGEIGTAADYIYRLMAQFYEERIKLVGGPR